MDEARKPTPEDAEGFVAPTTGEMGVEEENTEPTAAEMVKFVQETYSEILDEETLESIVEDFQGDFDDACGFLFATLIDNGVEGDEYFRNLAERGIIL